MLLSAVDVQPAPWQPAEVALVLDAKQVAGRRLGPPRVSPMAAGDNPRAITPFGDDFSTTELHVGTSGVTNFGVILDDSAWSGSEPWNSDGGTISFTVSGTATNGVDYVLSTGSDGSISGTSGSIDMPAMWKSIDLNFDVLKDNIVEGDETVIITLTGYSGVGTASGSITITIKDDPPVVSIVKGSDGAEDPDSTSPYTYSKPVKFSVQREGGDTSTAIDVYYQINDITTDSSDYTAPSGQVSVTYGAVITVSPVDDDMIEETETLEAELVEDPGTPRHYLLVTDSSLQSAWTGPATERFGTSGTLRSNGLMGITAEPATTARADIKDNDWKISTVQMTTSSQGIKHDDGSGLYDGVRWKDLNGDGDAEDAGEIAAPLSFKRGSTVQVTFSMTSSADLPDGDYTISGTATGVGAFTFSHAGIKTGKNLTSGSMTASAALADEIDADDLEIAWTITRTLRGQTWTTTYDGTKNRTYVTGAAVAQEFETVLDVACNGAKGLRPGQDGDTAEQKKAHNQDVVDGVWGQFSDNSVKRVSDGVLLLYNHDQATLNDPGTSLHLSGMLADATGRGQCTAWAEFFVQTLAVHGIGATSTKIDPTAADPAAPPVGAMYLQKAFTVIAGPAQGSNGLPYPNRTFAFHQVVTLNTYPNSIYDPSYGVIVSGTSAADAQLQYQNTRLTEFDFIYYDSTEHYIDQHHSEIDQNNLKLHFH